MGSAWWEQAEPRAAERALVREMLAGDSRAFEVFTSVYLPAVYRFVRRRLQDGDLARDIAQSALCKAMAALATFRGEAGLTTWLCACCRNEIAAHFRRRGQQPPTVELTNAALAAEASLAVERPDGPEQVVARKQTADLVHLVLDSLPAHYGQALEWKYIDELPVQEIATRLEIGPKAAESLLTRARQSFRTAYGRLASKGRPADAGEAPRRRGRAER